MTSSNEKFYKCDQCDFAILKKDKLNTHVLIHSGEKPNKCNQCDYTSSRAKNLGGHMKKTCLMVDSFA